jgi:ornithine carbamoyltransferase
MAQPRHFITLLDISGPEFRQLIERAIQLKALKEPYEPLKNKVLGMIFEKSSTRTRVSFEAGMVQFGGAAIFLSPRDTQLGRGEPIEDSARVLSRMLDCVMLRTHVHATVETFAHYTRVPVINGLTDRFHPCQLLADMQTYVEHRGDIAGRTVAWVGDGNNVCQTYIHAAELLDFELRIACPHGYEPEHEVLAAAGNRVRLLRDAREAVRNADLVVTDVWASMGQEEEQGARAAAFQAYCVDAPLMARAKPDAVFMHCLPAHRGEEISDEAMRSPGSVIFDQAENRLHAQKALMMKLMGKDTVKIKMGNDVRT